MKIDFTALSKNQSVDTMKTSHGNASVQEKENRSGFILDISGTVMDNAAYGQKGKTVQDIMQDAGQKDIALQKNYMTVMSNFMSMEDFAKLQEEGFNPAAMEPEAMVTTLDRIKVVLAQAGVEIAGYTDDLSTEQIKKITKDAGQAMKIAAKLEEQNLPVTKDNVADIAEADRKAMALTPLSEEVMKYMLENQMEPTVNNIYKAEHSVGEEKDRQSRGYFADDMTGYYAKKADSYSWEKLEEQIAKVLENAGMAVDEAVVENGKWMIEKGIPLSAENLKQLYTLKQLTLPIDSDAVISAAVNAMVNGRTAGDALIIDSENYLEQAKELIKEVKGIQDTAIDEVISTGKELTIENLMDAGSIEKGKTNKLLVNENNIASVSARRTLEEIRLTMTVEANLKLLKSGFSIKTEDIEKVVEELKEAENQYYKTMIGSEAGEELEVKIDLYKDSLSKMAELPSVPAAVLGHTVGENKTFTLSYIHEEGTILKNTYIKAAETYEALMTAPRKDMGDSIQKAFRNVDDLLEEMNLELDTANRRAVRILGYNNMEINQKSVQAIKEADLTLNRLMDKMTPGMTLKMIREGVNPMNMEIHELLYEVDKIEAKNNASDEEYSKYLWNLEKNNEISGEERSAFVGIYRLLRQVEKSDGSVVGSLLNQNAEITLGNLLSAVRTKKVSGIDVNVDDKFGGLEKLIKKGESISEQISKGFGEPQGEKAYYNTLVKEIIDDLEPQKLHEMDLRSEISLEKMAEQLKTALENKKIATAYKNEEFQELQRGRQVEEEVIRSLIDYEQPVTLDNLISMRWMMYDRGSLYRGIKDGQKKPEKNTSDTTLLSDNWQKAQSKIEEDMSDKSSVNDAYKNLQEISNKILDEMIEEPDIKAIDLKGIQSLRKQMALAVSMAKEENYEVPVEIGGEVTSINLKIIHSDENSGKVIVTMDTQAMGKVAAEFKMKDETVSGYMIGASEEAVEKLKVLKENLEIRLTENEKQIGEVSLILSKDLNINHFSEKNEIKDVSVNTRELYKLAKLFIASVKNTDN